jgi:Flp pilus assembly protein TadG
MMRKFLTLIAGGLVTFRRDRRGVSAVEFALISPVLILIYMGMAELSQGMTAHRRVSHAASAVGDLVAQAETLTDADMADIFAATATILSPYPVTTLKLRVTSITGDSKGVPKVDWSDVPSGQTGLAALTKNATVPTCASSSSTGCVPSGLITAQGDNVIMSESTYTYTALIKYVIKNGLNFSEKFYLRPRKVSKIVRTAT